MAEPDPITSSAKGTFSGRADRLHSCKPASVGPVTAAIAAMRNEPELPRRAILAAVTALAGTIVGWPLYKGAGPDLSFVAECWLEDARALGMWFVIGPDGEVWRGAPINDGHERAAARETHWIKMESRPRLMRAVRAAVEREHRSGAVA